MKLRLLCVCAALALAGCPTVVDDDDSSDDDDMIDDDDSSDDDDDSGDDDDDSGDDDDDSSLEPCEPSPTRLPTREVIFGVQVPDNTPDDEVVHLLLQSPESFYWHAHLPMTEVAEGVWTIAAQVEEGGLLRYTYDRCDGIDWSTFLSSRESAGELPIEGRLLLVTDELEEVNDVVRAWADLPAEPPSGDVVGSLTDAETGLPVIDATVSAGGTYTGSHFDGSFVLRDLAPGEQRVTVRDGFGRYLPAHVVVTVPADGEVTAALQLEPAAVVPVLFDVTFPPDTPADARIGIFGDARPLGGRETTRPGLPHPALTPLLEEVAPGRARLQVELREGQYVEYVLTLGSLLAPERDSSSDEVRWRSFVVDPEQPLRCDAIDTWRGVGHTVIGTIRVEVPPDTPPGVFVDWQPAGHMLQTGERQWTQFVNSYPGSSFEYRYVLGGRYCGADGTPDLVDGWRQLTIAEQDFELSDTVERWAGGPETTEGPGDLPVEFWVALPPEGPLEGVRLLGDAAPLAAGVELDPVEGAPWLVQATVSLPPGPATVHFDRGASGTESANSFDVEVAWGGQRALLWVSSWVDGPAPEPRPGFMAGHHPPDYWIPEAELVIEATFDAMVASGATWVALPSVWSYGQIEPLPTLETRHGRATTAIAPKVELVGWIEQAHQAGLSVLLAPQFNMEMTPGYEALGEAHDQAWWEAWLGLAEQLWTWNAVVAAEAGAEALQLPGPTFHVFHDRTGFVPESYADQFDLELTALIEQIRDIYPGLLTVSGNLTDWDFPGQADLVGATSWDVELQGVPPDATTEQWQAALEAKFVERIDPRYAAWGKPVVFYSFHPLPHPDAGGDPLVQARQLEALWRVVDERPWIEGTFTWDFEYIEAPDLVIHGLRGRPAWGIGARQYHRYLGSD